MNRKTLMYRRWRFIYLLICFCLCSAIGYAQNNVRVSGTVIDDTGEPLIGVSVYVKGATGTGTISDQDGKYSLTVPSANPVLVFSYLGYATQEVAVDSRTEVNITLLEDAKTLDEVVVVGYGTMRKRDLTGAITQIRPDKIANDNPKTVQDILRGTPGLSVSLDASAKGGGSMQIRGRRSTYTDGAHNDPLIILDGMMFYGELSEINPDDIGQIDILKDASAASIYGAKSANGVIIITTKKGTLGKPKINLSSNIGFSTMGANRKVYGPEGYLKFYEDWYTAVTYGANPTTGNYEAYVGNIAGSPKPGYYARPSELGQYGVSLEAWRDYTANGDRPDDEIWARRLGLNDNTLQNYLDGKTFDWYDHTFRTGLNQDHNVSLSGASDKMNYYMSIGYLSNEGVVVANDYKAVRSNLKLEGEVNKWLTISANVNFQDRTDGDLTTRGDTQNWQRQILDNSPFALYKDDDGNLIVHPMRTAGYGQGLNLDFNRQYQDQEKGYTVLNTIFSAKVKLPFNITYSFNASPRYQWYYERYWESSQHPDWTGTNGLVNRESRKNFDWSINNTINWEQVFAQKHRVNLTLVQEAEEQQYWRDRIEARDFMPTDALGFHRTDNGDQDRLRANTEDTHQAADGMLARLFYSYDDRYMLTGSVRRDGYSAFGTSNPRATFFSAAAAWTFTSENFFKWEPLSMGKLRISWGQNGNRSLANSYIALANLVPGVGTQGYVDATGANVLYQTLRIDRMANPFLQWEKTEATNVGLDLGFLNNRFSASMEFYVMKTFDMIMNQSLPGFAGFSNITCNLGEIQNKGFELTINSLNMQTENFEWSTSFGFSMNKNTIKHLYYAYEDVVDAGGNVTGRKEVDDVANKWFIGQPVDAIWDYRVTGIWQKDEWKEAQQYGQRPGDPKVANNYTADDRQNADGTTTPVYNDNDKEFLGQTSPKFRWSMRNDFTLYKDLSLSINIYSNWGQKATSTIYLNRQNQQSEITNNFNVYDNSYWTLDNPTNDYGRLDAKGPAGLDTPGKLINRSFIRLDNISVGYTLPHKWTSRLDIDKIKVSASVRNLAVWAPEWEYWDPETYDESDVYNFRGYAPRTFSFGLNVTF